MGADQTATANAINAIAAGLVNHVLVYRTTSEATTRCRVSRHATVLGGAGTTPRAWGAYQWMFPYNALTLGTHMALFAQRHFHEYGTRPEQLGQIAVNGRRNAALNPNAVLRTPITIDDYMASRMISSPLRLLDCDIHVDGCTALVLSRRGLGHHGRRPILVEAIGTALHAKGTLNPTDFTSLGAEAAAMQMWSHTDLKPADVDVAQIYDGYSILTLLWLEALGFCPKGEGGRFLDGGHRISLLGELPMNTGGGQLSAGRLHGHGHTFEACEQLWGRAGDRQVKDAEVAIVSNGATGLGCMLLALA